MARATMTPEENAERQRLLEEHRIASEQAAAILATHGMESPEFAEADKAAGLLWRRIREIDGAAGQHWMA